MNHLAEFPAELERCAPRAEDPFRTPFKAGQCISMGTSGRHEVISVSLIDLDVMISSRLSYSSPPSPGGKTNGWPGGRALKLNDSSRVIADS
jgi:hypothetical protein